MVCICLFQSCSLPKDIILDKNTLPACTPEETQRFDFIRNKMEGINVWNPMQTSVGMHTAKEEDAILPPKEKGTWWPVNGKKVACCGTYQSFLLYDGDGNEYDWNLNIKPDSEFKYIIQDVRPLVGDCQTSSEWDRINNDGAIQAEITPDQSLYVNDWFQGEDKCETNKVANSTICVYGAWVMDNGHSLRPEVHPSEAIWWRKRSKGKDEFFVFGIQDDSNRYDDPSDFIFEADFGPSWRPWAAPPIVTQIQIPFEYDGTFSDHPIITIEELVPGLRIVPLPEKIWADSDLGPVHQLKLDGKKLTDKLQASNVLVEVREQVPLHPLMGVRFSGLCTKPNGNIIGFVDITTAYGEGIEDQEGYHVLKITMEYPQNKLQPPVKNPGSN